MLNCDLSQLQYIKPHLTAFRLRGRGPFQFGLVRGLSTYTMYTILNHQVMLEDSCNFHGFGNF